MVDAPVSGCKEEVVHKCLPYFQVMGKYIFNIGNQCGLAQVAKLSNNLVLGINLIGLTETLKFGRKNSLPTDDILKPLSVSTGDNWVVNNWDAVKEWRPEATLGNVYKGLTAVMRECSKKNNCLYHLEI